MVRPITFNPGAAVEAALELFWKRGYHAVSVEDIVQETGLNRHSLYSRYGSKFGLLVSALEHYRGVVIQQIEQKLKACGSNRDRIEQLLVLRDPGQSDPMWEKMLARGCFAIRVCAELRDSHQELGRHLDEFGETLETLVTDVIRDGQLDGEFRRDRTPEDLASVLVSGFLAPMIYTPPSPRTDAFLAVLD
jgi:TetR/AcrR family transcriptional repressor of nem operon